MNAEGAAPDLGSMVSRLLDNPELLSQIATAVGAGGEAPPAPTAAEPAASLPVGQIMSLLGGVGGGTDAARRTALLSALKPYCNEHRCRTIDYMIGISKIAGGFSGFGK